jgi:hypothetical protein
MAVLGPALGAIKDEHPDIAVIAAHAFNNNA